MVKKNIEQQATLFVNNMLLEFINDAQTPSFIENLHPDITYFGPGIDDLKRGGKDANSFYSYISSFTVSLLYEKTILSNNFDVRKLSDSDYLVSGFIEFSANESDRLQRLRITTICKYENDRFLLYHFHISAPDDIPLEENKLLISKVREFDSLIASLNGGVCHFKRNPFFTIQYCGDGFAKILELEDCAQAVGKNYIDFILPEDRKTLFTDIEFQLETENYYTVNYRIKTAKGNIIWVLDHGTPYKDDDGECYRCVIVNISLRKKLEERLSYSDKRFNIALDLARANLFEYDPATEQITLYGGLSTNFNMPDIVRTGPAAFIETGLIEEGDNDNFLDIFNRIKRGESSVERNFTGIVDGKPTTINIHLINIFDNSGMSILAIGSVSSENEWLWVLQENEYARSLIIDREFICEANITADKIIHAKDIFEKSFKKGSSYKTFINALAKSSSAPEHIKTIVDNLNVSNITDNYDNDIRRFSFKFKGCTDNDCNATVWIESTVQIFKDLENNDLIARIYNRDITELVAISEEASHVRNLFIEAMQNTAVTALEVNFTKDKFTRIDENWFINHHLSPIDNYSDILLEFTKKHVLPEDMVSFLDIFNQKNIIFDFSYRKREYNCNFRQFIPGGRYRWKNCKLFTYLDPQSFEIRGFISFEDCHMDMESKIIFKYGDERDILTGLYKKDVFIREADNFLAILKNKGKLHGLILLNLDDFQTVNNTFGREYGDRVLATVADIIKKYFRNSDLLCRASNDEFCILIKDIVSRDRLLSKADEICKKLKLTFTEGMRTVAISASVGIAFSNEKTDCEQLISMAKDAMFTVKKAGKNSYSVYLS